MKKIIVILALALFIGGIVASSASAWWIEGSVIRVMQFTSGPKIRIERSSDSWESEYFVDSTNANEILAMALTAISNGSTVFVNVNGSSQIDTMYVDD